MRWLGLVVLGACHFAPTGVAGDAPPGSVDGDGAPDDGTVKLDTPGAPAELVRPIDLDDAKITGGPHADFPLLVAISATWLRDRTNGGDVARTDGFDIYFSADPQGTTRLAHEVELYTPDTGTLTAWVKIPSLVPTTVIYLHYGDPAITTSQEAVSEVWSGGFAFVMHLEDLTDATGHSTSLGSQNVTTAGGKLDQAMAFNGVSSQLGAGSATAIDDVFAAGGTAEGWFYANSYGESSYGRLFDKGEENGWGIYVANVGGIALQALAFRHGGLGGSIGSWFTPNGSVALGAWHHAAIVYDQSSAANDPTMYLDGVAMTAGQYDVPSGPMDSDAAASLTIGNRTSLDRTFDGTLDEMRLSSVVRDADWIATEVRNQDDPTAFYAIGAPL